MFLFKFASKLYCLICSFKNNCPFSFLSKKYTIYLMAGLPIVYIMNKQEYSIKESKYLSKSTLLYIEFYLVDIFLFSQEFCKVGFCSSVLYMNKFKLKIYKRGYYFTIYSMHDWIKSVLSPFRGLDLHQETQILLWPHDYNSEFTISLLALCMFNSEFDFDVLFYPFLKSSVLCSFLL